MKQDIRKVLITILRYCIMLALAYLLAKSRGFRLGIDFQLNARYLSDGLFAVGVFVTGLGLLVWTSSTGFFDMFSYAFHSLLVLFTPLRKPKEHESFYDYKLAKEEKRKKPSARVFVHGAVMLALAGISLWIYYC